MEQIIFCLPNFILLNGSSSFWFLFYVKLWARFLKHMLWNFTSVFILSLFLLAGYFFWVWSSGLFCSDKNFFFFFFRIRKHHKTKRFIFLNNYLFHNWLCQCGFTIHFSVQNMRTERQCRASSDSSFRSSLIWVYTVCPECLSNYSGSIWYISFGFLLTWSDHYKKQSTVIFTLTTQYKLYLYHQFMQ